MPQMFYSAQSPYQPDRHRPHIPGSQQQLPSHHPDYQPNNNQQYDLKQPSPQQQMWNYDTALLHQSLQINTQAEQVGSSTMAELGNHSSVQYAFHNPTAGVQALAQTPQLPSSRHLIPGYEHHHNHQHQQPSFPSLLVDHEQQQQQQLQQQQQHQQQQQQQQQRGFGLAHQHSSPPSASSLLAQTPPSPHARNPFIAISDVWCLHPLHSVTSSRYPSPSSAKLVTTPKTATFDADTSSGSDDDDGSTAESSFAQNGDMRVPPRHRNTQRELHQSHVRDAHMSKLTPSHPSRADWPARQSTVPATRAGPSNKEWDQIKPILENIYMRQQYTLNDAMEFMLAHYNFKARYVSDSMRVCGGC